MGMPSFSRQRKAPKQSIFNLGRMMDMIKAGKDANEAMAEATGTYGRFEEAAKYIDPRKE